MNGMPTPTATPARDADGATSELLQLEFALLRHDPLEVAGQLRVDPSPPPGGERRNDVEQGEAGVVGCCELGRNVHRGFGIGAERGDYQDVLETSQTAFSFV